MNKRTFIMSDDGFLINVDQISFIGPLEGGVQVHSIVSFAGQTERHISAMSVDEWARALGDEQTRIIYPSRNRT